MNAAKYGSQITDQIRDFKDKIKRIVDEECDTEYWETCIYTVEKYRDGYTDIEVQFFGALYDDSYHKSGYDYTSGAGTIFVTYLDDIALDDPNELRCAASENKDGSRPFATGRTLNDLVRPVADYIISQVERSSQYR